TPNCAEVIIGGPPCQGFSMAGARIRKNGFLEDPRNYLFKHYFNIVKIIRPKVFVIENVKGMQTLKEGGIFKEIIKIFSDPNNFDGKPYYLQYKLMKAKECGIPQARERMVIIGAQKEFEFDAVLEKAKEKIIQRNPDFFTPVTVWQAISDLPDPTGNGLVEGLHPKNKYQEYLSNGGKTFNHMQSHHSATAVARMARVGIDENYTVLDENINSVHSGSYGRLNPDSVAPTITTRFDTPSGGKFIHPYQNRTITPREAARIQSFPDSFIFSGNKTVVCRQIGNAVPPKLAYLIATMVKELL
ncbi:MAG: DNA cytosine methyltransferase, partial [Clostridia bacterium]|nr:DNA cytosine methyltransferase [Clostridia bacterium]